MGQRQFHPQHKELLREAAVIAEEMTFDFFKLSLAHWRRARRFMKGSFSGIN